MARDEGLCKQTVSSIMCRFYREGKMKTAPMGGKRRPEALTQEQKDAACRFYDENNSEATDEEVLQHLQQHYGCTASQSTLNRFLNKEAEYHIKRLYIVPQARNAPSKVAARKEWCEENMIGTDLSKAIFIDEAGFNLHLRRRRGRAAKGQRAAAVVPTERGHNLTLMVAICPSIGIVAHEFFYGGTDRFKFYDFLDINLFPELSDRDLEHSTLIMDNVKFHHSPMNKELIKDWGHRPLYNPAYTPHFNVAEWVFGFVRSRVSRQEIRSNNGLLATLDQQLASITPEHGEGWLREVKRWMAFAAQGHPLPMSHNAPGVPAPFDEEREGPAGQTTGEEALPEADLEQEQDEVVESQESALTDPSEYSAFNEL